jgi:type I restriction enzyme R subunit
MNNFAILIPTWPALADLGELAEDRLGTEPRTSVVALGTWSELLTRYVLAYESIAEPVDGSQRARLNTLSAQGAIPDTLVPLFHALRKDAETATTGTVSTTDMGSVPLQFAYRLAVWFGRTYGGITVIPPFRQVPALSSERVPTATPTNGRDPVRDLLAAHGAAVERDLARIRAQPLPKSLATARRKTSARVAASMQFSEQETRELIDFQLNAAGWEANSRVLRYAKGARPQKGVNRAIAEWPTASGPADYGLFAGLRFLGLVEAKKKAKDVVSDLGQTRRYSRDVALVGQEVLAGGPWNKLKIPFLFSTNGRPYLKQLEDKSGIWFLDVRQSTNHPRALQAWYSPEGLTALLEQDTRKSDAELHLEPLDYLDLRDYQAEAIACVETAIQDGKRKILVAMATGTGKTRVAIGLIYRLIKTKRFRRILFLVDRHALGEQTGDKFKETRLEDLQTFDRIFDLKEVSESEVEPETKVHISTVQGVMHRIMFNADDRKIPHVDQYDCIVVDEAHRGYTLDREMGEGELLYRDENDYISKYRKVLEYFDAVKIALTATPATHTVEIFDKSVYTYSYRQAVLDGWLVDHDPPHQIETKLKRTGIQWKKGDTVPVYDSATGEVTNIENIPDDLTLEVDAFNKAVITEPFNRVVTQELAKYLDPTGPEKTLIFAATDDHADMVVRLLKKAFEDAGCPVDDDAIKKITGSVDKVQEKIRQYRNERLPNIAVTVDLLTTGIDIHEICNLVFIRRVRSRILYEQMLGRGTRLREDLYGPGKDKKAFHIFDAVGLYETLEPVTSMKPVVPNPKITFQTLVDELLEITDGDAQKNHRDQILAKLQRASRSLSQEEADAFSTLSGGQSFPQFITWFKGLDPVQARAVVATKKSLFAFLDENRYRPRTQLVSNHEDELASHTRGYGKGTKPEDYLNAFKEFVLDNLNKIPALAIVCQRPRELTRQSLRELKVALDQHGFTELDLQTAWRESRNEDIAADIISFVRRLALGDPLISQEDRIRRAMKQINSMRTWTKMQQQWLERIERQLLKESLIERVDFDRGAFRDHGGFARIDKIFQGRLSDVLSDINNALYPPERKYAS